MVSSENSAVKSMVVMRKAFRAIDVRVSEPFRVDHLAPTQFDVLDVLYAKGPMKIVELLDSMLVTSGDMTTVIRNMEKESWMIRITCPRDKRTYLVGLTEQGRQIIEHALPLRIAKVGGILLVLTEDEQAEFIQLLKKFKPCEQNNL